MWFGVDLVTYMGVCTHHVYCFTCSVVSLWVVHLVKSMMCAYMCDDV